jgi:hypothetical protein
LGRRERELSSWYEKNSGWYKIAIIVLRCRECKEVALKGIFCGSWAVVKGMERESEMLRLCEKFEARTRAERNQAKNEVLKSVAGCLRKDDCRRQRETF